MLEEDEEFALSGKRSAPSLLRFGVFDLNLQTGELSKAGVRIKLQPQPFRVLSLLAGRPGELITREEIQQQVWGSEIQVDFQQGLNFCIKQIRSALGDDAETPRYVETLPRRGYRFLAPVERIDVTSPDSPPPLTARPKHFRIQGVLAVVALVLVGVYFASQKYSDTTRPTSERILLLVLPFKNVSGDPEQSYFADGFTEEMITQLGRLDAERLGIIGRTSAMQYKGTEKRIDQIGRELGVDYILEGGVRQAGGHVRISVQLIRVTDQTHLWADSYDRDLGNVLALQSEVTSAIAHEIGIKLAPPERLLAEGSRKVDPEAYEAYLKGRYYWRKLTKEDVDRAIQYFQQAIRMDPTYAAPYAGLADAYYTVSNVHVDPALAMNQAKEAALKALGIDGSLAEAHVSLGLVKTFHDWDWLEAERYFGRAIVLNPGRAESHVWYGVFLALMGRFEESIAEMNRARQLDPLSLLINWSKALPLYLGGQYKEALQETKKALELDPDFYLAHTGLGSIYEEMGEYEKAIAEFLRARQLDDSPEITAFLGRSYALAGKTSQAREVLKELRSLSEQRYVSPYDVALIYEGLEENEEALDWLEVAYESEAEAMVGLRVDPRFRRLRGTPRFRDLLGRMDFPE